MLEFRFTLVFGVSFACALFACGGGGDGSAGCPPPGTAPASEACVRAELGIPPHADRVLILSQSSHLDWDWLKTFEEYYTQLVDSVLSKAVSLMAQSHSGSAHYYYPIAEIGFLQRFAAQDPRRVDDLRALGGDLRIVVGGITSPDNLLPNGESFIRDYLVGKTWVDATLGLPLRAAWIPDDFGHDAQLPITLAAMGFDAVGFARVPDVDTSGRFRGADAAPIRAELVPLPPQAPEVPWPTAAWAERSPGVEVDRRALEGGLELAFAGVGRNGLPDTRAVLVVHRGAIVAERYATGFGSDSRFQSYSVAKSITHALAGILVRQGRLDIHRPADIAAWRGEGDPRRGITPEHLLQMTSGLDGADDDDAPMRSFSIEMTYGAGSTDIAAFATAAPLAHPRGSHWAYSTASTTIIAYLIGRVVGGGRDGMLDFMREQLFEPLGMRSAVPEFDLAGTFEGGMFVQATARDYARFGLLYLRGGVWDGNRILSERWVDFARTPAPAPNNGVYGAGFWLNGTPSAAPMQFPILHGAPDSTFGASGVFGQWVVIVPTRDLLVVRLGSFVDDTKYPALKQSLVRIVDAFPDLPAAAGARVVQ